jgi:bacillopeptidase F (M6 metalloprotease family)
LCEELGLQPTVFCHWQKEFFEHGSAAFECQAEIARSVYDKGKKTKKKTVPEETSSGQQGSLKF